MEELMLKIDNVSKMYKLGQIGGTTLRDELQRLGAKMRGKEDPTKRIGARDYNKGETFMALNGVSIDVKKGERVGIIGHNGAGKSTLLKLISRVTSPTGGAIGLNGRVASMLEVGTGFHGELTGRENIYMNGAILGMTRKEIDAKIEDIIDFSECRQFIDTPVKRYSSGMYVKLAFSVAAHLDSEIMIMDEVLAVGDMAFQKKCLNKMSDVSKTEGRTILYVSHNMSTIRQLCDRVIVLDHGKVVFDGDVEDGIAVYMGSGKQNVKDDITDFSSFRSASFKQPQIRIQRLLFTQKGGILKFGEKIHFCSEIYNGTELLQKVNIRVIIKGMDGMPVFMAPTKTEIALGPLETKDKEYTLDTSNLVPGRYALTVVLYYSGNAGYGVNIDVLRDVYYINIETADIIESLSWNSRWWGHLFEGYLEEG